MTTLICNCNLTLPLQTAKLGQALGEDLKEHSTLCRREAGAFQQAVKGREPVVVACTQEQRLFAELAEQDLQLEHNRWASELAQHENAYAAAMARADGSGKHPSHPQPKLETTP